MIDFTKPLATNIPGEVAIPLHVVFAGRQLVQITEPNGSQGLYLANDEGHILRLSVTGDYTVSPGFASLHNTKPTVRIEEQFINLYENGTSGPFHASLYHANNRVQTQLVRRVVLGLTFNIDENDNVTVTSRKVE